MTNLNLSLPEQMRDWIEAQIEGGRYGNASEYVRELIRRDQEQQRAAELEKTLLESLDSIEAGEGVEATPDYWEKRRQGILERVRTRSTKSDGPRG